MRTCVLLAHAIAASLILTFPAWSVEPEYPTRTITVIAPFAAGGPGDTAVRILGELLEQKLGQKIIVDNKPGGANNIGFTAGARAKPDGYTLTLVASPIAINPSLFKSLPYDPQQDFEYLSRIVSTPLALTVNSSVPATTLSEFIAYARSRPGSLNFSSPGVASSIHLTGVLFDKLAGTTTVHVPYTGGPASIADLLANRVQFTYGTPSAVNPHAAQGTLRILAITSALRSATTPGVPTMAEAGLPGVDIVAWYGLALPSGVNGKIVDKLHGAIVSALKEPSWKQRVDALGFDAAIDEDRKAYAAFVGREISVWKDIVVRAGIEPQ